MTSKNDGKDVKNNQVFGQKAKTYFIELYKTLEARLSVESELGARTSLLCEAWRRVHCLCQHSAISTHPHLISWLQRHTAQTILQSEWRQLSIHQDKHDALAAAIDFFIVECHEAIITRQGANPQWETQLLQRAEWFKTVIPDPWGNAVLKALLDPSGEAPSDRQILEWLKEERGVFFVTRLRQLASSKKTVDIALTLASAVMDRVRACAVPVADAQKGSSEEPTSAPTFTDKLTMEAGFTVDVWELITDIEFVLLYSDRSKCIALAKQTPLKNGYQLVERLHVRLDVSSREKRLWKNAKDVAILIAQVMIARCMVVPTCMGTARSTLYGCSRSLVKLLPADRLPAAMAALAAPAATARHLHTLAVAVDAECKNERKPFVCELYIRAITAGMNELERLKLTKEKESEARLAEKVLSSWFTALGSLLGASARLAYECALTAFSLHPSPAMYEHIRTAPQLQPAPVNKDIQEPAAVETNPEFGSWATDSRSQTNFVKTSETLNLKKIQQHSNVLSTAVLNEGEGLGLSPELCQDLMVLLSGPRVKTLSWDMEKETLVENCRSYMERTHGGTRALTTELKYLNLDPDSFMHLPEEEDGDEGDIFYGIEKGYEHLVELQEPEEIWEDALYDDPERTESCYSTENELSIPKPKKKGKPRRHSFTLEEDLLDPLSDIVDKTKHRSHSSESNKKPTKERSKERSKEKKKKDGQPKDSSHNATKVKAKKEKEKPKDPKEVDLVEVDVNKFLQKPKKERKKREKKEKKDLQKQNPSLTGLSRLVGKKIIKPNMGNTHEQISKREIVTDLNNQLFFTDSDYDSQGKSSITSVHTEGNDPDVLFDGHFSMDDIKSPEKTTVMATNKTYPIQQGNGNSSKRKSLMDSAYKSASYINSYYAQNDKKGKGQIRPSSATPSLARSVIEVSKLPPWLTSQQCNNETMDDVKLGIKRLIEFRKQKSATDLLSKIKHDSELGPTAEQNKVKNYTEHDSELGHTAEQNKVKNYTVTTQYNKFANSFGVANRTENEPRILPGSPKAISVPDIPKVFINKKQSQQLNNLKHEVDSYLLNQGTSLDTPTYLLNNLKNPEIRDFTVESAPKSKISAIPIKSDILTMQTNLNKFEQKLFSMFHQAETNKAAVHNVTDTSLIKDSVSNSITGNNASTPDNNKVHDFIKELQRSNNAGVSLKNRKVSGVKMNTKTLFSSSPTNYSAKQYKPVKKVENAPNTFARLQYMHKNKQGDSICKQTSDHMTSNELHKTYSEPVKGKNDIIDTLLSRGDCTIIRPAEKTIQKKENSFKKIPAATGLLNLNQNFTKKTVNVEDRLVIKSNSLQPQPPLNIATTSSQAIRTTVPRPTTLANCNDDKLRQLLRQNSICFVARPQMSSEVVMNKRDNIQRTNSPLPLNSQSLSQQLGDEIYNRLQGCPIQIQPRQSVPTHMQNAVTVKPKLSGVTKSTEVSTKSNLRHKPAAVITKDPPTNINAKTEVEKDLVQQDWEKVLNDLLSHKTPARDLYTPSMMVKKDKKQMPSTNSCDPRIDNSSNKINYNASVDSAKLDKLDTALKQYKQVIQQKSSKAAETNTKSLANTLPLNDALMENNIVSPVVNQPLILKPNDQSLLGKSNQTIIKRIGRMPVSVPQPHVDPIMSNVPSSEYDILGELMDDDLRQEIGELSSDEESFSTTKVVTKGKVKGVSSKLLNMVACPDSTCNLNIRQNQCSTNKQAIILQTDKLSEAQARSTTTGYETTNTKIVKSKPLHNTISNSEERKYPKITQKTKTYNVIQPASSCLPSNAKQHQQQKFSNNNSGISNPPKIIDSRTYNNRSSLVHNAQQSDINCSYQNIVKDNSRLITSGNQNSGNVLNTVPQQQPPIKNVVLIQPEIIYEPYTVQLHQIPKTVDSNIGQLNEQTFVAVNTIPSLSIFGAQISSPVTNPFIIGKSITVPIAKNPTSIIVNTCNINNPQVNSTSSAIVTEKHSVSTESNNLNKEYDRRSIDESARKLESHYLSEKITSIDNFVTHIPIACVKINDSTSRINPDEKVLSEVTQKHNIVNLPFPIKCDIKGTEKPTSTDCGNELDFTKVHNAVNDSTSHLFLSSEQHTTIKDVVYPYRKTDIKVGDCMLNKNSLNNVFSKIEEKYDVTTTQHTANEMNPEKTSAISSNCIDSLGPSMAAVMNRVSDNSISHFLHENSTNIQGVDNCDTDVKVRDGILNKNAERVMHSDKLEQLTLTSSSTLNSTNNMNPANSSTERGLHCSNFTIGKIRNASKNSILYPLTERCKLKVVEDKVTKDSKNHVTFTDSILNEKSDENKLLSREQENLNLKTPLHTSPANEADPIKSTEFRHHSNAPTKIQSSTLNSNPYFSNVQRTTISDVINYNPKTDIKLNESSSNKNCERKVLSEVQEKHRISVPEKTVVKTSLITEEEIKKDFLKTREERMARKKTAILNRQVHIFSDVEPIPLTYAPINTFKPVPDHKQTNTEMQTLSTFADSITNNECKGSKNLILDKINSSTEMLLQQNVMVTDSMESVFIDGSKENNISNPTEGIRVRLRSSNIEKNVPTLSQKSKFDNNSMRTKVRLKLTKGKDCSNLNKCKVTRNLQRKGHKIKNKKRNRKVSVTKDIINQNVVMPVSVNNLDIEEQLQGSVISKKDPIGSTEPSHTEISNNKDVVLPTISVRKKIDISELDPQNFKNKTDEEGHCKLNTLVEQKSISNKPRNQAESTVKDTINNTEKFDNNKEKPINLRQMLQSDNVTARHQQARKNLSTCENDDKISEVSKGGKSQQDLLLDHNKLMNSFKDNIVIEELPRKKDDDPLKRCISIKLPNGNSFKATVSGKLEVDINSLFDDPGIRSVLMNNIPRNRKCILNIQQVVSATGENIRTRIVNPLEKYRDLETINLISDDEEDTDPQTLHTEFGKYKVRRGINDNIFNEHLKRFTQRCYVKMQRYNKPDNKPLTDLEKNNEVKDVSSLDKCVSEPMLSEEAKLHAGNDAITDKNLQIIEIDDSSNDSIVTNTKTVDIGIQPVNTPDVIESNILELKETLLKDLCVDIDNEFKETNLPLPSVPENIPKELENLKETLLKDLCDDLLNTENEKLPVIEKTRSTDVVNDQNVREPFKRSNDIEATEYSQKNYESTCENLVTIKEMFVDSVVSKSVSIIKSLKDIGTISPTFKNKLIPAKKCQLKIEKCDDLAKKYELLKNKRCFVFLERCDRLITSQFSRKCDKKIPQISNILSSEDGNKITNIEALFVTEIDSSNSTLKRSGSFSILNEINLYDKSMVQPTECNIHPKITYDKYETKDSFTCQSDWLLSKSRLHSILKQNAYNNSIISDDASTDCDSDHDDICSNHSGTILDGIESTELLTESVTYQVPSLMQVALKFFSDAHQRSEPSGTTSSKTTFSLQHLKRKLSTSKNTVNNGKHMKLNQEDEYHKADKEVSDIKYTLNAPEEMTKIVDVLRKEENNGNEAQCQSATPILHNHEKVVIVPLSSNVVDDSKTKYEKNTLNLKLKNDLGNSVMDESITLLSKEEETAINMKTNKSFSINISNETDDLKEVLIGSSYKLLSEGNRIQGKDNSEHELANTPLSNIIAGTILNKEDEILGGMDINDQLNKNIFKQNDYMPREANGNENESLGTYANNEKNNRSDEVHSCCENVMFNLNSEVSTNNLNLQQDDMHRSKDTGKICVAGVIEVEKNNYPSFEQIKIPKVSVEHSKVDIEINIPILMTRSLQCKQNCSANSLSINYKECVDNNSVLKVKQAENNTKDEVIKHIILSSKLETKLLKHSDSSLTKTEKCRALTELDKFESSEIKEDLNLSKNQLKTASCIEFGQLELKKMDSVELFKSEEHHLAVSNTTGELNECSEYDERNKSINLIRNDFTLSNNSMETESERNVLKQEDSMESCNEIIYAAKHNSVHVENAQNHPNSIDLQALIDSHNEDESNTNVLTKCDVEFPEEKESSKSSKVANSIEEYDKNLKVIYKTVDLMATTGNDDMQSPNYMDHTYNVKIIEQFHNSELHTTVSETKMDRSNDVIHRNKNNESISKDHMLINMKHFVPDSNKTGRNEKGGENTTLLTPDLDAKSHNESLHEETLNSEQKNLLNTKNKENDLTSEHIHESTVIHIETNIINESIQILTEKSIDTTPDLNQIEVKCDETLKVKKPIIVTANSTKEISEINRDIIEVKSANKDNFEIEQLAPINIYSEAHKSVLNDVNESKVVENAQFSHMTCNVNEVSQIENNGADIKENVSSASNKLDIFEISTSDVTMLDGVTKESHSKVLTVIKSNASPQVMEAFDKIEINSDRENKNLSDVTLLEQDKINNSFGKIFDSKKNIPEQNDSTLCNVKANECIVKKQINSDHTTFILKNSSANFEDSFEGIRNTKDNHSSRIFGLSDSSESKTQSGDICYDKYKDIKENKIDESACPKNITLLYKSDSKVILKGSIIKNPIVGTCYVFPIINTEVLRPIAKNDDDCSRQNESITPDVHSNVFPDTDLIVSKPKVTYLKTYSKLNHCSNNLTTDDKISRRNLKRKIGFVDSKVVHKKYRKGKNIDYPKVCVTSVHDFGYNKQFKKLYNYCDSIKFSYTKQYHLAQLDDVHTMLQDWPIKESKVSTSTINESECELFTDIDQKTLLPDPMEQTLAEEILAIYDENESTSPGINEVNFSMGFGEGSGRVDQNLLGGEESLKISAVTLSDVKQSQPFLQSVDKHKSSIPEIRDSREKQMQKLDKCYSYIRLRDQVQSFFRKTTAELNYGWLKQNIKLEKRKSKFTECLDSMSNFPLDLNITDFFEPPLIENIVQVVQIGQLPVSTGAQNPVTCDPRVTQVSDASPPQCSVDNIAHGDMEPSIKTEYTELTTADISLPLMSDYGQHHQGLISATPNNNDNITIETEVKIEVLEDIPDSMDDQGHYHNKDFSTFSTGENSEYSFEVNDNQVTIKAEEPDVKIVIEPTEGNVDMNQIPQTYEIQQHQQNVSLEKPDQLAHAMNAAGITTTPEPIPDTAIDLSNSLTRNTCSEADGNNYQRSNITAMALQHALAQILPSSLNQNSSESENNPQVSVASQILHIVHGKNNSLNQITLTDNTQQSVISTATSTPVLHLVQSKNGPTSSTDGSPVHNSNSYSGLSLVDTGLSQGGNQLLHIVNTGNQKSNNGAQILKRVNLLTNLTNVQGSNEQKMVQFVCKSADAKGIQLNTNQRSMVLRLHTIESPQSTSSKPECQDQSPRESPAKESIVPQELKSRSVYEENYAKFIQNSSKQAILEKSTSLPKFNQAFGKPVFQEDSQKSNVIEASDAHLSADNNNLESNECQTTENSLHMDNIRQIASPPLLLRKSTSHTTVQQNLVQHIKQAITPMNIQTMHGGVIYTRQIPVNIGGGQTINLITVPSTERVDDSSQKQKTDVRSRSEIEPSIIKIVPQSPAASNTEISGEENNNSGGVSSDSAQNSQPPPMLTQMRIKLPMLSKNPQMVSAARVVRPSFFQIQRNVIGGPNQPVYQQLVLTAAPTLGQQPVRLPHAQTSREMKVGTESQPSPESQMSSSTLEQLREFDMVLEQVKERSTVQPSGTPPAHDFSKTHVLSNSSVNTSTSNESATKTTPSEVTQQVLYSIGNNQSLNVAYVNRKSTVVSTSTSATTSFARSPDSSSIAESPSSSTHVSTPQASHSATSQSTNGTHPPLSQQKSNKVSSKSKSRPKSHHPQFKMNPLPPKPNQKPMEDEQTTQRILYILAEYKEQVENSPDKDKPAPRRRTNLQAGQVVTPPGVSKRKKSSSGSRRSGRDSSPLDDNCRTMGSEDSSCGTSQGDCSESCQDLQSPQGSPRKVAKKLSFDHDSPVSQSRPPPQQPQPQPAPQQSQLHKQPQPQLQRNVLVTDGPTIALTRAAPGKPATAVLMPANYILPVSMVKNGQQIAIVTNRGPKILTVGGGEGGATNALLLQRLINPTGLKPVLARPGVRHVRLPTTALHNLQTFNLAAAASAHQPTATATSPVPATSPPELIDAKAPRSSWTSRDSEASKPEQDSSPERPDPEQEPEPEADPNPDPEPWNVPHDYSYEETVRTEMDRTVLDAIPDRYSPDMEAQRIFDKMFDVESKKGYIGSQDDSPRCPYDIDASDCDDKAYHQVVQRRDGVSNRHRFVSAATLRQKFALMEDELRLQKSLSEECEDLGVDSPSASDLFPEAELLFSSSPAHEVSHHTPQPVILNQSNGISKPDLDDQTATDQLISRDDRAERQTDDIDLGLEDVGIVTVSEDGMRATISLDHEEFVRSHPNTTFHSELTEEGEVQPVSLADLKARHITSTIFHAGRAPATVLVTAPQTTVISQATPDGVGVDHVRCSHADRINHDGVRFDLNEPRESNTTSAIIHSTGNATQVIRRVCYERNRYFLDDDLRDTALDSVDEERSSPERQSELFWETRRRHNSRLDFSSDSDKCCKSPYEENSTDSIVNMRLDSVIKDARGIDRSETSDDNVPPLRTYPPKRTYHDGHRNASGRSKPDRFTDSSEGKRRASNRGVVKRGCHCCNGTPAPSKPKKPRHKKPTLDFH